MTKGKSQTHAEFGGQSRERSSIFNLWSLVFFVTGVVAVGFFHSAWSSINHARTALRPDRTAGDLSRAEAQPWGELQITPMLLERPESQFETNNAPAPVLRWTFENYSLPQLAQFINSCNLTDQEKAALLVTNKWQRAANGWQIMPEPDLVKNLSSGGREQIYAVLEQSRQNSQAFPFIFEPDSFEEVLSGCELPAEKIALLRRLSYPKMNLRGFADLQLFDLLSSPRETRCLTKALYRVPTLLMELKVTRQSDLQALLDYWGGCGNSERIKPLLKSLIRRPGGAAVNVSFLMPSVPRLSLYTYPTAANPVAQDCISSAFNFFNDQPDDRFANPEYANQALQSDFEVVQGEKKFGDLLLLQEGDRAIHMCVYIAADIIYTKNGTHPSQPWILMKLDDLKVLYASDKPQQWRVFRKKHTTPAFGAT